MLSDAVIFLANMRGSYVDVGNTVHALFRMSGKQRFGKANEENSERVDCRSRGEKILAAATASSSCDGNSKAGLFSEVQSEASPKGSAA